MATLIDRIKQLDDSSAIRILTAITDAQCRNEAFVTESSPSLEIAVGELIAANTTFTPADVTAGDLARTALLALSEDESLHAPLESLISGPSADHYQTPEVILSVGAVLVTLQIGWTLRNRDGKIVFEKKTLTGKHFVDFAGQLFAWLKQRQR